MNPFKCSRSVLLFSALAALLPASAIADEPAKFDETPIQDNLDDMLRKQSPELLKYLRSKNYANVGVLKFLVKKGDAPASDNVGELNLSLANRLEVALVLSNPDQDLGIIQQASRTVSKENIVRASHLTKEGRKAFFAAEYDLAWGPRKVAASAFVTGLVVISKDLKQTKVRFQVFDQEGKSADVLDEVVMETTPRILTESGYSYLLSPELNKEAFATAKKSKGNRFPRKILVETSVDPLENMVGIARPMAGNPFREGPVKLNIFYSGKLQPIENGLVPEPNESDRVTFELENPTTETYAVVLKLNGRNTLFAETFPDLKACHKWILRPGEKQAITGFQIDDKTVSEFKVLSPRESEENEVYYGENAGTFHLAAFKGSIVKEDPSIELHKVREETEVALAAIGRGALDLTDIQAGSLNALKRTLRGREKSGEGARGMIVQSGAQGKKAVERFFFEYDYADPVHDMTLRYYVPKRK